MPSDGSLLPRPIFSAGLLASIADLITSPKPLYWKALPGMSPLGSFDDTVVIMPLFFTSSCTSLCYQLLHWLPVPFCSSCTLHTVHIVMWGRGGWRGTREWLQFSLWGKGARVVLKRDAVHSCAHIVGSLDEQLANNSYPPNEASQWRGWHWHFCARGRREADWLKSAAALLAFFFFFFFLPSEMEKLFWGSQKNELI